MKLKLACIIKIKKSSELCILDLSEKARLVFLLGPNRDFVGPDMGENSKTI